MHFKPTKERTNSPVNPYDCPTYSTVRGGHAMYIVGKGNPF
jgi:hypothetical protein